LKVDRRKGGGGGELRGVGNTNGGKGRKLEADGLTVAAASSESTLEVEHAKSVALQSVECSGSRGSQGRRGGSCCLASEGASAISSKPRAQQAMIYAVFSGSNSLSQK